MGSSISAGDVGRYAYCPLNWKLSLAGEKGQGGKEGIRIHAELADRVDALEYYQASERQATQTALYLSLFAASAAAIGVELFLLDRAIRLWWILVFLSVLWAAGTLYLVVFSLYYAGRRKRLVRSTRIEPGAIVFSDSTKHPHVLESRIVPLRGRPDYVVERDGQRIPVEVKTGKTPPQPYQSHVLQLAAYCYLVNEEYGKRPPFGILAYPERHFEIAYTADLEDDLLRTLLRIQLAERTGDVHRNHESRRRCLGCSRREACPERLA